MKDMRGGELKRVKPADEMTDEQLMKHLELRHPSELKMKFAVEPGKEQRELRARGAWEAFHDTIHRIATTQNNHWHGYQSEEGAG